MQYWQIFSLFLIFCCYFARLKAREISCKKWETWKIFPILHSAPCDNNYLLHIRTINYVNSWLVLFLQRLSHFVACVSVFLFLLFSFESTSCYGIQENLWVLSSKSSRVVPRFSIAVSEGGLLQPYLVINLTVLVQF